MVIPSMSNLIIWISKREGSLGTLQFLILSSKILLSIVKSSTSCLTLLTEVCEFLILKILRLESKIKKLLTYWIGVAPDGVLTHTHFTPNLMD